jgi:acetolactate synthase I/II/III large subunit
LNLEPSTLNLQPYTGNGAQILVECLHRAGVQTIFGVPGDTGVALYDALYDARDRVTHVLARDERSAAMMADAYARCGNRVGTVEASSGGGTTFLVGGLGEAFAASVPVLVVTSDIHRSSRGTGALTEIDQAKLFSAVTKWAATVSSAGQIPSLVTQALTAATTGRPAPVSLVFPEDVFDEMATVALPDGNGDSRLVDLPRERTAVDRRDEIRAAEALNAAARPAIVAGSGVHISQAWSEIMEIAELGGIPVATSIHGKGSIAENSPWSLGVVGANGAREYANEYLASADVVLFIGTRANATDTNSWKSPPRDGMTIIGLDIDPERAGRNFPGSIKLVGDARTVLNQILERTTHYDPARPDRLRRWIAQRRTAWEAADRADSKRTIPDNPEELSNVAGSDHKRDASHRETSLPFPADVVRLTREIARPDVIVIADPGTATPNVAAYWETCTAGRSIIVPRGHGPMGYAIPAAIGASIACPRRTVIAFTGDGSFAMSCGELETACRLDLPITYVQFTNGSMGWIKMLQHLYHQRRYFGVDMGPTDAAAAAAAFGLRSSHVDSLAAFEETFRDFYQSGAPTFIDVAVPEELVVVPPVAPWQRALAGEQGRPVY